MSRGTLIPDRNVFSRGFELSAADVLSYVRRVDCSTLVEAAAATLLSSRCYCVRGTTHVRSTADQRRWQPLSATVLMSSA